MLEWQNMAAQRATTASNIYLYMACMNRIILNFWYWSKKWRYICLHVFHIIVDFWWCIQHHVIKYALCACSGATTNLIYLISTRFRFISKMDETYSLIYMKSEKSKSGGSYVGLKSGMMWQEILRSHLQWDWKICCTQNRCCYCVGIPWLHRRGKRVHQWPNWKNLILFNH
jgi:hypothetical protein